MTQLQSNQAHKFEISAWDVNETSQYILVHTKTQFSPSKVYIDDMQITAYCQVKKPPRAITELFNPIYGLGCSKNLLKTLAVSCLAANQSHIDFYCQNFLPRAYESPALGPAAVPRLRLLPLNSAAGETGQD